MRESEVTGNCHASFGERDGEPHKLKDLEVRSVPTLFSPLLANIALHGMEEYIRKAYPEKEIRQGGKRIGKTKPVHFIRYADDFVVLHNDLSVVEDCQTLIGEWLTGMGLELKASKTKITHTLHEHESSVGFDFLGFTVRQHPVGKYQSGKNAMKEPLGFKTLITPSKNGMQRHRERLKKISKVHRASTQETLIDELNPVIRGWSNYYSTVVSSNHFSKLDNWMYTVLHNWAVHRHANKSPYWIIGKYWLVDQGQGWRFAARKGQSVKKISRHTETSIKRHIKVQEKRSPYDGDWVYWSIRMGSHPETNKRVSLLLKRQKGKCPHCKLFFKVGDLMEVDHITPRSAGGKDEYQNLQLLHRHCHDTKSAQERANGGVCMTNTTTLRSRVM